MAIAEVVSNGKFRIINRPAGKGQKAPLYMELMRAIKSLEPGEAVEIDITDYGKTRGGLDQTLRHYARKAQIGISTSKTGERTVAVWRNESGLTGE